MIQAQRGNVTLITAFTAMLLVLLVVFSVNIANVGSESTRIQASSDDAAVTAASTYIGVVNDETIFKIIDWGLGFLDRLVSFVQDIGYAMAAVVLVPPVSAAGSALVGVTSAIRSVLSSIRSVFQTIQKTLDQVLEEAKVILAVINATLVAANNGYLGFIVPKNTIHAGTADKYTIDDINRIADQYKKLATDGDLVTEIQRESLETVWSSSQDPKNPAASKEPREGVGPGSSPDRNVLHIWNDNTPGCDAKWSRPCNERDWVRTLVTTPYASAAERLDNLIKSLKLTGNDPPRVDPADQKSKAQAALQQASDLLHQRANPADKSVTDFMGSLDQLDSNNVLGGNCVGGQNKPGGFIGFRCDKNATFSTVFHECEPGADPKNPLPPCYLYWDMDIGNFSNPGNHFRTNVTLPDNFKVLQDLRSTNHFQDFVQNHGKLSKWKKDLAALGPSIHGAEPSADAEEAFVMTAPVRQSTAEQVVNKLAGKPTDTTKWAVTASIAKIYKAKSTKPTTDPPHELDTVKANDICVHYFPDKNLETDSVLHIIYLHPYGWCHILLGAFDAMMSLYYGIKKVFYDFAGLMDFGIPTPFGTWHPFGWAADLVRGAVDFLLGEEPPDARTYHVALVGLTCVPALDTIADVAQGKIKLSTVIALVQGDSPPAGEGSCKPGSDPGAAGSGQ